MVNSGNGHGNGHQDKEPDTETTYTPLEDGVWVKETEHEVSLTDGYAILS